MTSIANLRKDKVPSLLIPPEVRATILAPYFLWLLLPLVYVLPL